MLEAPQKITMRRKSEIVPNGCDQILNETGASKTMLLNPKCALGFKMPAQPLLNPCSTPLFWVSFVPNWFCTFFVCRPVRFGPGC